LVLLSSIHSHLANKRESGKTQSGGISEQAGLENTPALTMWSALPLCTAKSIVVDNSIQKRERRA
jgi:hypothetical protein